MPAVSDSERQFPGGDGQSAMESDSSQRQEVVEGNNGQRRAGSEQELATKMLYIQNKRFYLDLKENHRGKYLKIAEIGLDGRRNQIFMPLSTAIEFRENLNLFSDFYDQLEPLNVETITEDGHLKSQVMFKDSRRYYLDLKENNRGRFLRVSQTINRGTLRFHIAVPAQGLREFRNNLSQLLEQFCSDTLNTAVLKQLPDSRTIRVDNKTFYFDVKQNQRGVFMRISEVKVNFRAAITIPEKTWCRFHDVIADFCDKIKEQQRDEVDASNGGDNNDDDNGNGGGNGGRGNGDDDEQQSDEGGDKEDAHSTKAKLRTRSDYRMRGGDSASFKVASINHTNRQSNSAGASNSSDSTSMSKP